MMKAVSTMPAPMPARIDPEALLMKAVESGQGVDTLERLLALRERLQAEYAAGQYRQALLAFQAECPKIGKATIVYDRDKVTKEIIGERYRYASLETIQDITRPLLHNHGFAFDFDTVCEGGAVTVVMTISHAAGHEKKSQFKVPIDPKAYMTDPQKYESAMSFAQRIAFRNGFGLITGTTDNNTEEPPAEKAPPPPAPRIGKESPEHMSLLVRIAELGLSVQGVEEWCSRHFQVFYLPDLNAAQHRDLLTRLPGFAVQKLLRQIPKMTSPELEALIKQPPDWLKPMDSELVTILETADRRLTDLQSTVREQQGPEPVDPTFGGDLQEQIAG